MSRRARRPTAPDDMLDVVALIDAALTRRLTLRENGKTRRVTVCEAILLQLWRLELDGNPKALKVRLAYEAFANSHRLRPRRKIIVEGGLPAPYVPKRGGLYVGGL